MAGPWAVAQAGGRLHSARSPYADGLAAGGTACSLLEPQPRLQHKMKHILSLNHRAKPPDPTTPPPPHTALPHTPLPRSLWVPAPLHAHCSAQTPPHHTSHAHTTPHTHTQQRRLQMTKHESQPHAATPSTQLPPSALTWGGCAHPPPAPPPAGWTGSHCLARSPAHPRLNTVGAQGNVGCRMVWGVRHILA